MKLLTQNGNLQGTCQNFVFQFHLKNYNIWFCEPIHVTSLITTANYGSLNIASINNLTNNLLYDWNLRNKFVDDTSALEIIPRNSISVLNNAADDIHNFAMEHKLNPTKCKEMLINFLRNPNFLIKQKQIGGHVIEQVRTYKILAILS